MSTGLKLIARERARQIASEGWTTAHDDQHRKGELAEAAQCYLAASFVAPSGKRAAPKQWPWDASDWKPKGCQRDLVRAGALFLAEAERLERRGDWARSQNARQNAQRCAIRIDTYFTKKA